MDSVFDGFDSWEDVCSQFGQSIPVPDEIFLAEYWTGNYEGDALVVYRTGDKYYWLEGSHCSCYGLEISSPPEEYDLSAFKAVIERKYESFREILYGGYGATTMNNITKIRDMIKDREATE